MKRKQNFKNGGTKKILPYKCNITKYGTNKIQKYYVKIKNKEPRKDEKIWKGSEFPETSKTRPLIYLCKMPSKLVSTEFII